MAEPLLTAQEVAQMAGVASVSTVSSWVRDGKLKRAEGGGAHKVKTLYRQSDVEAFLKTNDIRNTKNGSSKRKAVTSPEDTIRDALTDLSAAVDDALTVIEKALGRVEVDVRQRIAQDVLGNGKKGGRKRK